MTVWRCLFGRGPVLARASFEWWANQGVGVGEGLRMLSAQAANEALRHCRIGMVTRKNLNRT